MKTHLHWAFARQGPADISLRYWSRQIRFASAEETLRCVAHSLEHAQPGAYLRFGQADIDAALGRAKLPAAVAAERAREVRAAFLLSGPNLLKSLDVNPAELVASSRRHGARQARRETLEKLNAVGACFLDAPMYSYTALDHPAALSRLVAAMRGRTQLLVTQAGSGHSDAAKWLGARTAIEVDAADVFERLDRLEQEILGAAGPPGQGFPIVIVAIGTPGRLLARRLLKHGFQGYVLDLDNLQHVAAADHVAPAPIQPAASPRLLRDRQRDVDIDTAHRLSIRWEGPFLGHYSYAIINRELASRLGRDERIELSLKPSDTPFTVDPIQPLDRAGFRTIAERVCQPLSRSARIHIRNHAQHPFVPPTEGRWVAIQPWDFKSLPTRWIEPFKRQVDEVWVPSRYVQEAFLEAGIPAEQVAVVPNGVDVDLYRPGARKVKLDTRKTFKFLFVGGPFWRKGFDLLLDAYGKAFTARDSVCLVIKSAPEFWTREGSNALARFRSRAGAPEIVSLVQSLDPVRMAGLYASCQCLVHPYRAEGFAMCIAEGMASGLPVIVTGMGGSADFCNESSAYLIPARAQHLSAREVDQMPTMDFPTYAEPELDALVEWMRHVYEHPQQARSVASKGMSLVRNEFTWDRAAQIAVQRLLALASQPIRRMIA